MSRNLRIAVIGLTYPFRGGIAHYTTLLCRNLNEQHEARLFSFSRQYPGLLFPGTTQMDSSDRPIEIDNDPCLDSLNPFSWYITYRRIRAYKPDLILISWWHPFFAPSCGTVARLARRFAGIPTCYLCHNVIPHERSWIDRLLLRYAYRAGAGFITHSQGDLDDLHKLLPGAIARKNPHPAYDEFATTETPHPAVAKAQLGVTDKRVLLFFGFVREYKGLRYLLEAMDELSAAANYHLLLVGEFYDDKSQYAEWLDRLQANNQLTLVDRYVANEEIPLYYAAADLLVVPYVTATQSGVIQIAYGFDTPVVATTVGGLPEVVVDGETGYLVPPQDSKAVAAAIEKYYEADPESFRVAIERERERYSWDHMVATVESIAAEIADRA